MDLPVNHPMKNNWLKNYDISHSENKATFGVNFFMANLNFIYNKTRGLRSWPSEKQKKQKVTEKCLIWQVSNINSEISLSTAIYKTWPEV